ncbi:hypothetical protein E3W66_00425 [Gammaproteobacteria bacterium LSUCC0057]|uniref:Lipoprotein n=1 Tax=Gammaproteobacteria bacterium LSUCC0057 TaxID=2559237 RepID=A0A4Y8UJE7_9GAMM|nr:hypothetical protein E3W66_00425 [Gammaproteobacteria bacterium LSUCC0057]
MSARYTPLTAVVLALLLSACGAITTVDEYRSSDNPISIADDEQLTILGRRDSGHYETDREFVDCIGSKVASAKVKVVPEQAFIDAIYPWFEPRVAPKTLGALRNLLANPLIEARLNELNLRYLVWVDGSTESATASGSLSCAVGPGGGGCFGFAQWDKSSIYEAIIWDLRQRTERGRVRVDSQGTSYLIGAVAPIPLLTPVKSDACAGLGGQLRDYFAE